MLIRLFIENLFSFGNRTEFNMIPNKRLKTLEHHKYKFNDSRFLKISTLYGANGAGKSNFVKSLDLMQKLITGQKIPLELIDSKFKLSKNDKNQILVVEFIQNEKAYYYGLELNDDIVITEELYISGIGVKEDKLIYERKTNKEKKTEIKFMPEFENDEKSQLLKSVLIEEFVKADEPILKLVSNRDNKFLRDAKNAYSWFSETLQIITPISKPRALAHKIDKDAEFKKYAEELMCSFNIGITSLTSEKKDVKDFFGEDNENELNDLIKDVKESPKKMIGFRSRRGDEIVVVEEDKNIWVKQLKVGHKGKANEIILFDLEDESDGTIRLLDFVPAIKDVIRKNKVIIIDEIERSIHPLLIKELIKKFSLDSNTKGQLIFTTHESNLLDQDIFRQDEIWFAEKDKNGSTDLYSLSDFKEHKTIDIRKGYLNGRYGSIPFLSNLRDLNWHKYDIN